MPTHPITSLLFASLLVLTSGCGDKEKGKQDQGKKGPLLVSTVNEPLRYFAELLGGGAVRASFPMKEDGDPAFWTPDAETVLAYQKSDLILRNGADYAKWIPKVSLLDSKVVDSSKAIQDRLIEINATVTHQHGPSGKHNHAGFAFTTWLDPLLALEQAAVVKEALQARLPEIAKVIEERFTVLRGDLQDLDAQIRKIVAVKPDLPLLASHPVYQYLQSRYKLALKSVHWEPDETPSAEQWSSLEKLLAEFPARSMLWESVPLPAVRDRLASLGIQCLVYDPCATTRKQGDFMTRMRKNVKNLSLAWR